MMKLAESYAERPQSEWPMLFQRILSNAILDWFRRQKTRNAVFTNLGDLEASHSDEDGHFDLLAVFNLDDVGTESADASASRAKFWPRSKRKSTNCQRVNVKRFCCVTGRNWMLQRRRLRWAARKAASRRIAPALSMRWHRLFKHAVFHCEQVIQLLAVRSATRSP